MKKQGFVPPGFIVGEDRSGTTLFAAILNRHPKLYVLPETHFFSFLGEDQELCKSFKENWPKSWDKLIEKMNRRRRDDFTEWGPPSEAIYRQVDKHISEPKEVFEALGRLLAKSEGKELWLEKTPGHIRHLSMIREAFPKAPILHIVRDGRDVAHSLMKVRWGSRIYWKNLLKWKNDVSQARCWLKKDANSISIRYEDLVKDPGLTIAKVCDFINLDFFTEILQPNGSEHTLIERGSSHKEEVKHPIHDSKVAIWRRTLPEEMQSIALMMAGKELREWGYGDNQKLPKNIDTLRLSKNIVYSHNNRPQFDRVLSMIASLSDAITFEGFGTIQEDNGKNVPDIWLTNELPVPQPLYMRNRRVVLIELYRFWLKLKKLQKQQTKLVWIYAGHIKDSLKWRTRRVFEITMARYTNAVICFCSDSSTCKLHSILKIPKQNVVHLNESEPQRKLKKLLDFQ